MSYYLVPSDYIYINSKLDAGKKGDLLEIVDGQESHHVKSFKSKGYN